MQIPVTFSYNNKQYSGILSKVSGAGSNATFHLYINKRYLGQLLKTDKGWQFLTQSGAGGELGEVFGKIVEEAMKG